MERCTPKERKQVKEYLTAGYKELFEPVFISESLPSYPVIKRIKTELYSVELQQREERNGIIEKRRQLELQKVAKNIARKKLKSYQRGRDFERMWDNKLIDGSYN